MWADPWDAGTYGSVCLFVRLPFLEGIGMQLVVASGVGATGIEPVASRV
jgi:hypothetical protein